MIEKVDLKEKNIEDYYQFLKLSEKKELNNYFSKLKNKKVIHLNSTSDGGGVAQLLKSLVPFFNSGGLTAEWYTIKASEDFFKITKKIHNYFQGQDLILTKQEKNKYLEINKKIAKKFESLNFDFLVVHDPQPMAVNKYLSFNPVILRMHLDTSGYSLKKDKFFSELIKSYNYLLFSDKKHVFVESNYLIAPPAIDPLSDTNKKLNNSKDIIQSLGINLNNPLISQVSRFDKFKNPTGVINIFKELKKSFPDLQLILFGICRAQDDPEAKEVFEKVKRKAAGEKNIKLFFKPSSISNINANEKKIVNAIQRESNVVIQNSYREAFGLTVTEAMWKKTPVVGGPAVGIKKQIKDGKNGFVIESEEEGVRKVKKILKNKKLSVTIGKQAKKSVRRNYLITGLANKHLKTYSRLTF